MRRALDIALVALLAVLVAATLAVAAAAAAGVRPHVELSDSMRPALRSGDVLWLERIAARAARRGDVVAFREPGGDRVLLHRVRGVRRLDDGRLRFHTRGDAVAEGETWVARPAGALGRYTGVRVPGAGRVIARLGGAPLAALGVGCCLLLGGLATRRIWRPD